MSPEIAPEKGRKKAPDALKWYAIYTNPRAEKLVFERLEEVNIEAFLPLIRTYRTWSDRKKLVIKPLLSSYVFVRVLRKNFPKVYTLTGVVRFISFDGKPVPIPQEQIDNLRLIVDSDAEIEVTCEALAEGDKVKVARGNLEGLTGELIRIRGKKKVVVRLDKLEQNIILTIPVTFLEKA